MIGIVVKAVCCIARILLTKEQAYKLAPWWAVKDPLPAKIDAILLVSFGATKTGLSNGTQATTQRACELLAKYPNALLLFGEFTKNPISGLEAEIKHKTFPTGKYAGQVISTIEEEEECEKVAPKLVDRVLIVSDEAHSRGVKLVGKKVWGKRPFRPEIFVDCVSSRDVIDLESPMETLRDPRDWVAVNIFRQLILWLPGGFALLKGSGSYQPSSEVK